MAFEGASITLVGLLKIELPEATIRICDGGFCDYDSERYTSADAIFGTVAAVEPLTDTVGDMAPEGRLVFLPPSASVAAQLSDPAFQNSRMRFWLGEIGSDWKTVENAELLFDGLLDQTILKNARGQRALEMIFMSRAEKLFLIREGNTLSGRFHKTVFSGELGFDNATGLQVTVAWGIEAPPRSGFGAVTGGGGSTGGFIERFNVQER